MIDAADIFAAFRCEVAPQTPLRTAITAAYRAPEPESVPALLKLATANTDEANRIRTLADDLAAKLRTKTRSSGVEGLIHEYSLSSQEGVALMCLAEALLRIPDAATRDALIRDKLSPGDWRAHVGQSPSLFVNAATWGLVLTGRLVTTTSEQGLSAALTRLIARSGEPIIRAGVDVAMRLMGERADAVRFACIRGCELDERGQTLGLRRPVGGGDRGPERRLRSDLAAERGENVGGLGHVRLPEAVPIPPAGDGGRAILFSGKAFCLCREMRSDAATRSLAFREFCSRFPRPIAT